MKKELLFGMMAALTLAASCQNDFDYVPNGEETAQVTFNVGTPEIATRAFSDGTSATQLEYAVYSVGENDALTHLDLDGEKTFSISTDVQLQLTTGNKYAVIFWAAAENATYYTVDFDAKTMTVDYTNAESNDEERDAFYAYHEFTVTGSQTETVYLKRPFAQLNIGTNDYDAAKAADYAPAYSYVTVPVSSELNLVDGTVNAAAEVEFKLAAIPANEEFPVADYDYLLMNYLLVPAEKEVVDIEFGYSEDATTVEKSRIVGSVPVQRNHRTNIYGQLLTSDVDINVEIKPGYDDPALELDELHKAALNGGEITLTEDVVLTSPLEVYSDMTINLNGYTISASNNAKQKHVIKNSAKLVINGGTISSLGNDGGSAVYNEGTLELNGVTVNGAPYVGTGETAGWWPSYAINNYGDAYLKDCVITSNHGAVGACGEGVTVAENCTITRNYTELSSHVFYINHANAQVYINGGEYHNNGFDGSLASVGKGTLTVNGGDFYTKDGGYGIAASANGTVNINGGNFNQAFLYWGGKFVISGGSYSAKPKETYLAENKAIIEKDGRYYVVNEDVDVVASSKEDLPKDGSKIDTNFDENTTLFGDITLSSTETNANSGYGATGVTVTGGAVLDGQGNTLTVNDAYGTWDCCVAVKGGTIKNLTVKGAMRGIFMPSADGDVYIDNVIFKNVVYTFNSDGGNKNYGVYISNCTLNGWTSHSDVHKEVVYTNCSFGEGSGYAYCRPYGPTSFVGCDFEAGFAIEPIGKVTFENCTVGGVALTAENLATLVVSNSANASIK